MKPNARLRGRRNERGLSQMDAAIEIGIGRYRYWQIENGYMDPTPAEKDALAKLLETGVDDLFTAEVGAGR